MCLPSATTQAFGHFKNSFTALSIVLCHLRRFLEYGDIFVFDGGCDKPQTFPHIRLVYLKATFMWQ